MPNDYTVVPSNSQSTPKKKTRKSSSASACTPSAAKAPVVRSSGPVEILFTLDPNPHRQPLPPYIWIDFPTQSETLKASTYVIRLGVGGADLVEISIDNGAWLPCRLTSGYWWYDWSAIKPGKHTMVARMRTSDGRWFKTPLRQCDYPSE